MPPGLDKQARAIWRRLVPFLYRLNLLTEADTEVLATLCRIHSRLVSIAKRIDEIPDHSGLSTVLDKLMVQERQYQVQFRHYASEFGLSPRGRVGLTVKTTSEDGIGDLLD